MKTNERRSGRKKLMDLISSFTNDVVTKALNGHSARHTAISSNLANVDTPGYSKQSVSFEGQLQQAITSHRESKYAKAKPATNDEPLAMTATHGNHITPHHFSVKVDDVQPELIESDGYQFRNDHNSVDAEVEMVALAENTQQYLALANVQSRMLRSTKSVIGSGGN